MQIKRGDVLFYLIVHSDGLFDFWHEVGIALARACFVNHYSPLWHHDDINWQISLLRNKPAPNNCFVQETCGLIEIDYFKNHPPHTPPKVFLAHLNIARLTLDMEKTSTREKSFKKLESEDLSIISKMIIALLNIHPRVIFSINCHGSSKPCALFKPSSRSPFVIAGENFYTQFFSHLTTYASASLDFSKLVIEGAHCEGTDVSADLTSSSSFALPYKRASALSIRGVTHSFSLIVETLSDRFFKGGSAPQIIFYNGVYSFTGRKPETPIKQVLVLWAKEHPIYGPILLLEEDDYIVERGSNQEVILRPTMSTLWYLGGLDLTTADPMLASNKIRNLWVLPKQINFSKEPIEPSKPVPFTAPKKYFKLDFSSLTFGLGASLTWFEKPSVEKKAVCFVSIH